MQYQIIPVIYTVSLYEELEIKDKVSSFYRIRDVQYS